MADGRANNGGARKGAGRKSKADEEKVKEIFSKALKQFYAKESDEEANIEFVKELLESQRGQIFVAEHVFGKPKETIDLNAELPKPLRKHFEDFQDREE